MQQAEALHLARLAQLEGAVCALLREAAIGMEPNDQPDGVTVRMHADGIDIELLRGSIAVAGYSL